MRGKVAIIGAGCTTFGENFGSSYSQMIAEAGYEALGEAGLQPSDIQAAWLSTAFPDIGVYRGRSGMDLAEPLALYDIPITRVSNFCASGGDAFRAACLALLSGEHDVVLAVGAEKLRDRTPQESIVKMMVETGHPTYQKGFTAAGTFATFATRHMYEYGTTREAIAGVSVKNHAHGIHNEKAHYRKAIPLEKVLGSPMVADPLTLMDACPTTDGAAAVVLCRTEDVAKYTQDSVPVLGQHLAVSASWDGPFFDPDCDFLSFRSTQVAAKAAYEQAGITNPLEQIDFAEVHDCFSIVELLTYEDLGFCKKGEAASFLAEGHSTLGGTLPVNVSGGLLSCGHPVGATGLRMIYELTRQIQGRCGERQVKDARIGLAHNIGGPGAVASVTIVGRKD